MKTITVTRITLTPAQTGFIACSVYYSLDSNPSNFILIDTKVVVPPSGVLTMPLVVNGLADTEGGVTIKAVANCGGASFTQHFSSPVTTTTTTAGTTTTTTGGTTSSTTSGTTSTTTAGTTTTTTTAPATTGRAFYNQFPTGLNVTIDGLTQTIAPAGNYLFQIRIDGNSQITISGSGQYRLARKLNGAVGDYPANTAYSTVNDFGTAYDVNAPSGITHYEILLP